MPRHRKGQPRRRGSPRRGHARIGKPRDSNNGHSSPLGRSLARLGKPLCLGVPAMVQGLCL